MNVSNRLLNNKKSTFFCSPKNRRISTGIAALLYLAFSASGYRRRAVQRVGKFVIKRE